MKTIKHCIRCQKEHTGSVFLTKRQSENLKELDTFIGLDIIYSNIICDDCADIIGDEISSKLLKTFSDETNSPMP